MSIKILSPVKISTKTSNSSKNVKSSRILKMNIKQLTTDIHNRIREDNSLGKHLFI